MRCLETHCRHEASVQALAHHLASRLKRYRQLALGFLVSWLLAELDLIVHSHHLSPISPLPHQRQGRHSACALADK